MNKYILDSDTLIYLLKGNEVIAEHISSTPPDAKFTTIINHAELLFGAYNSTRIKSNLQQVQALLKDLIILPFCEKASTLFAEQKASLKQDGNIIADLDLMIASICLNQQMILVTNNTKHFSKIKNLQLENWTKS